MAGGRPGTGPGWPRFYLTAACLIFFAVLLAYSNSFHAEFHLDDSHQIVDNRYVRSLTNIPGFFTGMGQVSAKEGLKGYRPVTDTGFAVIYALAGYDVRGYHLVNVVLHALNAFLVYLLVSAVLMEAGHQDAWPVSLLASLAFALHPIQTGAVTYISGLSVLLSGFFYLAALLCFMRFRRGGGRALLFAGASLLLFLLGLLSKEVTVSLVAVMAAYDLLFTVPRRGGMTRSAGALKVYVPFLAIVAAFVVVKEKYQGLYSASRTVFKWGVYPMSEAKALLVYLRLMFFPVNQNFDYKMPPTTSLDFLVLLSALLVAVLLILLYRRRRTDKAVVFFGLWFFVTLAPESTLIAIPDIVVEYRMYLPSVGLLTALAVYAARVIRVSPSLKKALATSVLLMFGILTFGRNFVYADDLTLWSDVLRKAPYNARAYLNLGHALMSKKRYPEASALFRRSLELDPSINSNYAAILNLGVSCYAQGYYKEAEEEFNEVMAAHPADLPEAYFYLGRTYAKTGRYQDAVGVLLKGVAIAPDFALTHFLLADLYMQKGKNSEALREILEADRCSPKDFNITFALADIYYNNGMVDKARETAGAAFGLAQDEGQRKDAQSLAERLKGQKKVEKIRKIRVNHLSKTTVPDNSAIII